MKCINKYLKIVCACALVSSVFVGCKGKKAVTLERPYSIIDTSATLIQEDQSSDQLSDIDQSQDQVLDFMSADLCVAPDENSPDDPSFDTSQADVVGIMDTGTKQILYQKNIFQKMYPASTTKIMTAYLAIKYGKLDDLVTVKDDVLMIPGFK